MAIGTTAAILGSAVIGAGASMLSSRSQSRSANRAADAQTDMARENNALAREFRGANQANFQPWLNSGTRANSLVDSFLFGPQAAQAPAPPPATTPPAGSGSPTAGGGYNDWRDGWVGRLNDLGLSPSAGWMARNPMPTQQATQPAPAQGNVTTTPAQMMDGYQTFVNSPYYQNPLNEGYRAMNQGYAANGMLQSGAAMKGITKFGQDYSAGRMGEFINMAERQSDRGIQSAGGIAGVGMNALSAMSGNNRSAADALSNAAIARGNANANMWSGIGSAVGSALGRFGGGSSYGAPPPYTGGPITVTGFGGYG